MTHTVHLINFKFTFDARYIKETPVLYWNNSREDIAMKRKRDKIWTAIIATKQWFTKLFTSEADALLDDFENNPPPEIGTQPYSGDTKEKGD